MKKTLGGLGVMFLALLGPSAAVAFGNDLGGSWKAGAEAFQKAFGTQTDIGLVDVYIWLLAVHATADSYPVDLLRVATELGVEVERAAIGYDDTPLTDLIDDIGERFGSEAATIVEQSFDRLIEELGPNLLADVDPIVLPPGLDIDNGEPDDATVSLPTGFYILDIGTTQNVGDGEFSRVVLGLLDRDGDDNDAEQLLREIITGHSGANLDFEREPGIVDVRLADISLEAFTLELEDGDATDMLTLSGPGAEAVIAKLDAPADITDLQNSLSLVEIGVGDVRVGRRFENPIFDLVGGSLDTVGDVEALIDAAISGDERINLVGFDDSRISLVVHNGRTGSADTLVLFGDIVEDVLSSRRWSR